MYKFQADKTSNLPLSNNLFYQLQADILTGEIKNGEKLTEQDIGNKYGVSRTPVREALRQLENEGLVENIPNRGAFAIGLSEQDIEDMYELRRSYEVQAVKWAIERITEKEFDELEETFEFMKFYTMKNDAEKMLNINANFHQLIYKSTHNRMLVNILASYQLYFRHIKKLPVDTHIYLKNVLEEHRLIFQAFKNRDVALGIKAMEAHMINSKIRFYE